MAVEHENLVTRTLIKLSRVPKTRAWANNTGTARSMDGLRVIRYGLVGSSDVLCISRGRFVCAEIKIGKDVQREEQQNFQSMIENCGGLYFLIRSEADIDKMIEVLS